jgi:hypothetical protein
MYNEDKRTSSRLRGLHGSGQHASFSEPNDFAQMRGRLGPWWNYPRGLGAGEVAGGGVKFAAALECTPWGGR